MVELFYDGGEGARGLVEELEADFERWGFRFLIALVDRIVPYEPAARLGGLVTKGSCG